MVERFIHYFFRVIWYLRSLYLMLIALILFGAVVIAAVEPLPFGHAVYFAFVTAFTIGYGDLVPHNALGHVMSVLLGFVGVIFTGLMVGAATLAVRKAWEEIQEGN